MRALRPAIIALFVLAVWVSAWPASSAWGRECGGRRVCRCGDHVTEDYELVGDLGPCEKHGLVLKGGVTLDGGGHAIRGSRAKSSVGVVLAEQARGARLTNVEVTGFERGVRLAGVQGARVDGVESHHNGDPVAHKGYGIDVARGASENVIENVNVHHNADEGIHIGNGARGNRVVEARVHDNHRENVYFLENQDNRLERSTLSGGSASSVFVKHAEGVHLEGNRVEGRGVQIRGDSAGIRLVENQLVGMGLTIQPYSKGTRGHTVPRDITVSGGRVQSQDACVRLVEARAVRLEGVALDCERGLELAGGSDAVAVDTLLRQVACRGPGTVRDEVRIEVRFVGPDRQPAASVEIVQGGERLGISGADGSWKGTVTRARIGCPGPTRTEGGEITLRSESWSRSLDLADLKGEISVGGG